jgi:hypothetical protein
MKQSFIMAPGSRIVTEVPESDSGDDRLSDALESIRLDADSTCKPWSTILANVALSSLSGLNDLLECPVCTNSMLPPILQVCGMMAYLLPSCSIAPFNTLAETATLIIVVLILRSSLT